MDIKAYIESGILESYILGELSTGEKADVELMLQRYPELQEEKTKIEEGLEALGRAGAIAPPQHLKEKIMNQVEHPVVKMDTSTLRYLNLWKGLAAACFILAAAAIVVAINFRQKYIQTSGELALVRESTERMASDYNRVNQRLDALAEEVSITSNAEFQRIALKGTENNPENRADVFWNPVTEQTYLKISNLREVSEDQQYQLWAIKDGVPIDAGVFSSGDFIRLKTIAGADAFAITVEPRGGSDSPTLSSMLVIGNVSS